MLTLINVIPNRDPVLVLERFLEGLGLFPEVLVLERFLEGSTPISLLSVARQSKSYMLHVLQFNDPKKSVMVSMNSRNCPTKNRCPPLNIIIFEPSMLSCISFASLYGTRGSSLP